MVLSLEPSNMAKRKRSEVEQAAIVLLTRNLVNVDHAVLCSLENRFKSARGVTDRSVLEALPESLGRVVYQLLFRLRKIEAFFGGDMKQRLCQVLERPDRRIEVLRKSSKPGELSLSEKFERLLADRSLAISCRNVSPTVFLRYRRLEIPSHRQEKHVHQAHVTGRI